MGDDRTSRAGEVCQLSKPIVFLRIAQFEFDDAADWYEVRRSGRGGKFIAAIRAVLEKKIGRAHV